MPEENAGGQTPPAPTTPQGQTPPTSGQTPTTPQQSSEDDAPISVAEARRLREELKQRRETEKTALAKLKTFEDAQLSDSEKKDKALSEAQQAHATLQEKYQRLTVHNAVLEAAPALGINGKLAARLINWGDLKIDDEGQIAGLDKALKALLTEFPEIAAQQPGSQQQQPTPRQNVPPSNPQRGGNSGAANVNPRNIPWSQVFKQGQ